MGRLIGIDLGETWSVMAIEDDAGPRVLETREGRQRMRSAVGVRRRTKGDNVGEPEILVGDSAYDNLAVAPEDTILSIRRLIGRGVEDPEVQKARQRATCQIVEPSDGTTDSVRVVIGQREYSPVEISALILHKLKRDAEFRLGEEVTHAVITVPAYFSETQRAATREAGIKAGLKVMKILDEPSAAAIAFGIDSQQSSDPKNILVYDLGGGTFDVSVLMWAGNVFAPLDLEGDMWLGGDNFDQVLVDHALRHVKAEYGIDVMNGAGVDNRTRLRFLATLKEAAQKTKERLSCAESADLIVAGILKDEDDDLIDVELEVTRGEFENMIVPLVERSVAITKEAVKVATLMLDEIDAILLVGECTCVPIVRKTLEDVFGREKVMGNVRAEHAKALGAAIFRGPCTGIICQSPSLSDTLTECGHFNTLDATVCAACGSPLGSVNDNDYRVTDHDDILETSPAPFHYGIQTGGDRFLVLIHKNDEIPAPDPHVVTIETQVADQHFIRIPVFGGLDLEKASANEKLHEALAILPPGLPKGTAVWMRLWLNWNGLVKIAAHLENGTDLKPWILKGGLDAKAVEELQNLEYALARNGWNNCAAPNDRTQMEDGIRAAYAMVMLGDYNGAIELAQRLAEKLPRIIID